MQQVEFLGETYTISFDAMPDTLKEKLQEDELAEYLSLLEAVQCNPRNVYQRIKDFSALHPDVAEIINLLTFAHIQNRRILEAEKLIEETYLNYPDYFFARVNYADQCIRKKKLEKVTEIFPSFDLQELYPGKKVYHTSEFRGFLLMAAYYFRACKKIDLALTYFGKAKEIEPHHPSVHYLDKKLHKKGLFRRLFSKK